MKQLKIIVLVLLFVLLIVAGIQNIEPLRGKYITLQLDLFVKNMKWETKPIPIGFVAPFCFLLGIFLMGIVDFFTMFRLRRNVKQLTNEVKSYRGQNTYASSDSMDYGSDKEESKTQGGSDLETSA